jgi:hypothetical protein
MKTFREHLNEEIAIGALSCGGIDIERDAIRDEINGILAGIAARPCVTPYASLNKVRKALAYFHIHLPKKVYLEGRHGMEVWEVNQFGTKMGVTDTGEWINQVPAKYYLFFHYHLVGSMYYLQAKIVDDKELESKIGAAESMVAEEADAATRQAVAKAAAPKEDPHTALGDCDCSQGDSPSTKKAVDTSMKKQIDEVSLGKLVRYKNKAGEGREKGVALADKKMKGKAKVNASMPKNAYMEETQIDEVSAGLARRAAHSAYVKSDKMKKDAQKEPDMHSYVQAFHKGEKKNKQGIKFAKYAANKMEEDKDPCWKGYEMVGMKKKGGRKVPNCVPVKEEQIDEVSKELANRYRKKAHASYTYAAGKREDDRFHERVGKDMTDVFGKPKFKDRPESEKAKDEKTIGKRLKGLTMAHKRLKEEEQIDEKAPPGAKFERMVKHIKKGYSKDGLSAKEKSIAYATAWKAKKREESE